MSSKKINFKKHYSESPYKYLGTSVKTANVHKYFTEVIHPNGVHSIEARDNVYPLCCVCGTAKGMAWHIIHTKFFFICSLECEQNFSIGYANVLDFPIKHKYLYKLPGTMTTWALLAITVILGLSCYFWLFTNT